ncbi:MAG: zf-HC2 domain-containing protein [Bryobacteraceae bacterium]|jgi:hypothetical protein
MTHGEAIRFQAGQKYATGELAPAERDAFEEHFFDCLECAEAVRWEMMFTANARSVLAQRAATSSKLGLWVAWLAWLRPRRALTFSLAANAALALGFSFVLMTGSRDPVGPRLIPAYFAPGPAHGSDDMQAHSLPPGIATFLARIPSPGPKYLSYSYQILNADGKRESAGAVIPPAGQDTELYLEVPLRGLPEGVHTLEVCGNPGARILSRFKFHNSP